MKKNILLLLILQLLIIFTAIPSYAFELYGCWKSDQENPLNVIRFQKDIYYYGRNYLPAKYFQNDGRHVVIFNVDSEIHIVPEGDNTIKVTYPNPSLPKNIVYTRINEEEAANLIKKR